MGLFLKQYRNLKLKMRILSQNLEMTKMKRKKMSTGLIFQMRILILRIRKKKRL
jgi:hypothetical protein